MPKPTVAILGASADRSKYGNKSVRAHLRAGYDVYPVNPKADQIEGLRAFASLDDVPVDRLDRISVYLPPAVTLNSLETIAARGAGETFFNPGTATAEILEKARQLGIQVHAACSIVDLGLSPAEFP